MSTYAIKTFGCQMNENDSQKMGAYLQREGYRPEASCEKADVIVINTCSIREKSYQKAVSEIGRLAKRRDVKPVIAVTGCVASHDSIFLRKKFPFIDILLGPDHVAELPRHVQAVREKRVPVTVTDFTDISDYEFPAPPVAASGERVPATAYVTIMKGCDNACSFCIVPFVRGAEVSRPAGDILDEVNRLCEQGVREVTLLGQNVNSYGRGFGHGDGFPGLLRRMGAETGIRRIRFTSPHPKDLSTGLIEEYRINDRLCPHIHLPVQSGSNRVLKRMRRSYTRQVFMRKVEALRKVSPDIGLTTDIIVGFPGETDADFEETLSLVREAGFDASYSFAYSQRPLTEAAGFVDDVTPTLKKERLYRLQELQAEISLARYRARIGCCEEVLVEGPSKEGGSQRTGRTRHGRIVNFDGDGCEAGDILSVEITGASSYSLTGKVLCSSK